MHVITQERRGRNAHQRLKQLGLGYAELVTVVLRGEDARAQATDNDPLCAAAWDAYRYRVRSLRDIFCQPPFMWSKDRDHGLEMILSDDARRSVVTRSGDEGVGVPGAHPQPKTEVGDATKYRLDINNTLLFDPNWLNVQTDVPNIAETWMFLVRRHGDTVCAELSLPSGMAKNGSVSAWVERILLEPIDLTDPGNKRELPPPVEIDDVPITRKR